MGTKELGNSNMPESYARFTSGGIQKREIPEGIFQRLPFIAVGLSDTSSFNPTTFKNSFTQTLPEGEDTMKYIVVTQTEGSNTGDTLYIFPSLPHWSHAGVYDFLEVESLIDRRKRKTQGEFGPLKSAGRIQKKDGVYEFFDRSGSLFEKDLLSFEESEKYRDTILKKKLGSKGFIFNT